MAKLRILLDTNIILDILTQREPFYQSAARVWAAIETHQIEGFVAAHAVTTLYYITARHLSRPAASAAISDVLRVLSVTALDQEILMQALALGWPDFEDAVQACAAAQAGIHYLITRDASGYPSSPVQTLSPADFLSLVA